MEEKNYFRQIEKIFKMKKEDIEKEFLHQTDIDFHFYYRDLFKNPKKMTYYENFNKHIISVTNGKCKKVLDIGCGFGLDTIYLCVSGARVIGMDVDEEKLDVFKEILNRLTPPLDDIEVRLGDAVEIDFQEEKFDIIVCNEMISHVRNLDLFLYKMYKALKRGGLLYIHDNNNKFSIHGRYKRRVIWKNAENKYKLLRENIIRKMFNLKQDELINLLAEKTAGMYGDEIPQAVCDYLKEGKITKKVISKSRDPISGFYLEREFNPYDLRKKLFNIGFRTKILHPYFVVENSSLAVRFVSQAIKIFHPFSLFASPKFEILAKKV